MPIDAKITGLDEMRGRIRALQQALREQIVREGVREGARVIRDEIILKAPLLDAKTAQSTSLDPGAVKADIRSRMLATDKQGFASARIGPGARTAHVVYWVEFGHRLIRGGRSRLSRLGRPTGPGREIGIVQPHPFVRPAFEMSVDAAVEACRDKVREQIQEVLR